MSAVTAPQPGVPTDGCFTMRTVMGTASYTLTVRYNARMDRWIMDVADAQGNTIVTGLPMLTNWPVYGLFLNKLPGLPQGALVPVDLTGNNNDGTEYTMGGDVQVFFAE